MMKNTQSFHNKAALITGAGTGMGADTAVLLAERGARVVLVGRRSSAKQRTTLANFRFCGPPLAGPSR